MARKMNPRPTRTMTTARQSRLVRPEELRKSLISVIQAIGPAEGWAISADLDRAVTAATAASARSRDSAAAASAANLAFAARRAGILVTQPIR